MSKTPTIVLPTDFSPATAAATELCAALASRIGARVLVLHVVDAPFNYHGYGVRPEVVLETRQKLTEWVDRELDSLCADLGKRDVKVEPFRVEGVAAHEIVEFAAEHDADMIVLGTHGYSGIQRYFMGSVAERVVRTAGCPVLTTRS